MQQLFKPQTADLLFQKDTADISVRPVTLVQLEAEKSLEAPLH